MRKCSAVQYSLLVVSLAHLIPLNHWANAQENTEDDLNLFGGNNSAFGEDPFNNGESYQDFNSIEDEPFENGFDLEGNQDLFLNEQPGLEANLYKDALQAENFGPAEGGAQPAESFTGPIIDAPFENTALSTGAPIEEPIDFFTTPEPVTEPYPDAFVTEPQDPFADSSSLAQDPFSEPFGSEPGTPVQQAPQDPMINGIRSSELADLRKTIAELKPKDPGSFPDEYIVQPGDTLWDISDQLLDDPFWWPKLWSYNPGIINPHLIAPGMKIVFESSNGVLPPAISLADNGDFLPVGVTDEDLGIVKNPLVESWKALDGTIVDQDEIPVSESFDIFGDLKVSASKYIRIPGYIAGNAPQSFAEIAPLNTHRWAASKGDIVYTEPSEDWAPEPGEQYLVVRGQSPAEDTDGNDHTPGFWVYSGVVGVLGREQTGRLRMIVEESEEGVRPGDRIVPFQDLLKPVITKVDREPREAQALVAAIGNGEQTLASLLDVIHLIGRTSDLREGDIVPVYSHPSGSLFSNEKLEFARSGFARIISVSENTAMGVVIHIDREIALGSQTVAGLSFQGALQ